MRHLLPCLALAGCFPDDWNGLPYQPPGATTSTPGTPTDPTTDADPDDTGAPPGPEGIVGRWVSEGSDLSDLFSGEPFGYVLVEATFRSDGGYVVTSEDDDGATYVLSGTYTTTDGAPGAIALFQAEPYEAEAEGIWQVDGDELTYEVVQTVPDYGFAPPTTDGGFGSTAGPGMAPGVNVQVYRRE